MSAWRREVEARRAALSARADTQREDLAQQFAPIAALDAGIDRLRVVSAGLAPIVVGAGLGLSALVMALPVGGTPAVRGGVALLHLAGSVRRLFLRR